MMCRTSVLVCALSLLVLPVAADAAPARLDPQALEVLASGLDAKVVAWRRDIHQHPELSNRETRTAALVAKHLRALGLDVHTGIAHTGVAAVLKGGRPGPTIALRADMDALPVTERVDVPFKSTATGEYRGETVGVMHACGHDGHTAILMGVAEALASRRESLPGTVLFIFQPAEEGAPPGERGGASLMLEEGVFDLAPPEAAFGLHLFSSLPVGVIGYRAGPFMAASDRLQIVVTGRQTHGSRPWGGVDPIVTAAEIVMGLQTIVSRETDITKLPAVVTIGTINGGVRYNIIPDTVEMWGTLRTFDADVRSTIIASIERKAQSIAAANGATATLAMGDQPNPVTRNDPALTERMLPTLQRVAGKDRVREVSLQTGAEDFAFYANRVPSLFFWVGVTPPGKDPEQAPSNHSPLFYVDEASLGVGLRALLNVAVDYLEQASER
jgi:amidohydrolase